MLYQPCNICEVFATALCDGELKISFPESVLSVVAINRTGRDVESTRPINNGLCRHNELCGANLCNGISFTFCFNASIILKATLFLSLYCVIHCLNIYLVVHLMVLVKVKKANEIARIIV